MSKWIPGLFASVLALAQVEPDAKLRANRDTYSPVMATLKATQRQAATDEQLHKIGELPVEAVWSALDHLGYTNSNVTGMRSTQPGTKLVGRALTIQYLPRRPDLDTAMETLAKEGDWPAGWHVRAGEEARPGDVMVVDLGGELTDGVFWGDVSATSAKAHGARGAVLYGSTRDLTHLRDTVKDFPVLALGFDPNPAHQIGVAWNVPIRVGKVTVLPGDIVLADDEAVFFFPATIADKVISEAKEKVDREVFQRKLAEEKNYKFRDIYPLNQALEKEYERQRKTGGNLN